MATARRGLAIVVLAIVALSGAGSASEADYLEALSEELANASSHLDQASRAISGCNDDLLACLRTPSPTAQRIDGAVVGLESVLANLSAMDVPGPYAESHAVLLRGFQQVIEGLGLYSQGLTERDLAKLDRAAELVHDGKEDIERASAAILSRPTGQGLLLPILAVVVVAFAVAIGAMGYVLFRQEREVRRARIRDELATCPVCGEVLDLWQTFRVRQIRAWRADHLRSHEADPQVRRERR